MSKDQRMISLGFDPKPYPAGTHMCLIYNDDEERRLVMSKFIQSGLGDNEQVGYFADTPTPQDVKMAMREMGVPLLDELDGRQYSFVEADKVYCPDGTFQVDRMIGNVGQAYHRSVAEGYAGARVTGEMTWSRKGFPGSDKLVEYEASINILVRSVPTTAICQYDARKFDGATLYGILSVHPMMIVHGQVVLNPYYIEPEVFLASRGAGMQA